MLRTYGPDYKLIFVGDATMSPYEIIQPGGSVEHWNDGSRAGLDGAPDRGISAAAAWLNPQPEAQWGYTQSIGLLRQLMEGRMFPLTLGGLEAMTRELSR